MTAGGGAQYSTMLGQKTVRYYGFFQPWVTQKL
jgi:hypothetical protein